MIDRTTINYLETRRLPKRVGETAKYTQTQWEHSAKHPNLQMATWIGDWMSLALAQECLLHWVKWRLDMSWREWEWREDAVGESWLGNDVWYTLSHCTLSLFEENVGIRITLHNGTLLGCIPIFWIGHELHVAMSISHKHTWLTTHLATS